VRDDTILGQRIQIGLLNDEIIKKDVEVKTVEGRVNETKAKMAEREKIMERHMHDNKELRSKFREFERAEEVLKAKLSECLAKLQSVDELGGGTV